MFFFFVAIEDVRLVFRDGKVREANAHQGQAYLDHILEIDAGVRYLGEFAFGNNPRVDRGTRNILFDEKMGGTIYMALGNSYPETGVSTIQRYTGIWSVTYVAPVRCG